jgi:hypothetical protein
VSSLTLLPSPSPLFTIIPSNLIQLLKNEIFEGNQWRKKDLKLIRHQQNTNLIALCFLLFSSSERAEFVLWNCENDPEVLEGLNERGVAQVEWGSSTGVGI